MKQIDPATGHAEYPNEKENFFWMLIVFDFVCKGLDFAVFSYLVTWRSPGTCLVLSYQNQAA